MIKIFLQDRSMTIVRDAPRTAPGKGVLMVHSDSVGTTLQAFRAFEHNHLLENMLLIHPNPISHIGELKERMKTVIAAGGIVQNANGELLMIFRKGKWDLPKGKLEPGESPDAGAVREVMEECGVPLPETEGFFGRTYHVYNEKEEPILKETWWFKMKLQNSPALHAQKEEGITEAVWADEKTVTERMPFCYGAIGDLLKHWMERNRQ
ncbi:MAG: NUDIX domain-containing protein [Bacteroidia bacterium]|nr:NUDIX domain-containing protein [Bacteroidia bacterium]